MMADEAVIEEAISAPVELNLDDLVGNLLASLDDLNGNATELLEQVNETINGVVQSTPNPDRNNMVHFRC